jgi:arsenite methyltransferase
VSREPGLVLRAMRADDWPAVAAIWADGIATGQATFETAPPDWSTFDATRHPGLRLVAYGANDRLLGWAAASRVSSRQVYAGVVEHSVYVAPDATRRGVGRALLLELLQAAEEHGIWTVQAGIFPENAASLALHEACGFHVVGRRERLGRHDGRWRDVLLVEWRRASD